MKSKISFFIFILLILLSINCVCAAEHNICDAAQVNENFDSCDVDIIHEDIHLESSDSVDVDDNGDSKTSLDIRGPKIGAYIDDSEINGTASNAINGPQINGTANVTVNGSQLNIKGPKIGAYIDDSEINRNTNITVNGPQLDIKGPIIRIPINIPGPRGTFDGLQVEINNAPSGSTLYLFMDYVGAYGSRIQFNKDLTIDGRGHTLDCAGQGGCSAFYSSSGNIILKNLRIINGHNDYTDKGGAIYISGSAKYTLENCTFENNWAEDFGGAIYNEAGLPLVIRKCSFISNKAENDKGGAIYSKGALTIEDSIFDSNIADEDGGAVCCEGNVFVRNSTFRNNKAKSRDWSWYEYIYHWADNPDCHGGAIFSNEDVNVENSTFINNYAEDFAGAICARNVKINVNQISSAFNSFFINNVAGDNDGGAIYASYIGAVNTCFRGNTAVVDGGALYSKGDVNVRNCLFDSNRAEGAKVAECFGGAMQVKLIAYINNSTFINNYAGDYGGAIYANQVKINADQKNCEYTSFFINNVANDNDGGAIWAHVESLVSNTYFEGNVAKAWGSAIYLDGDLTLCDCSFKKNRCISREEISAVYALGHLFLRSNAGNEETDDGSENITMEDVINATGYEITKMSENAFTLTFNNNTALNVYRFAVYDLESFRNVTEFISSNKIPYDMILIDFKENLTLEFNSWAPVLLKTNLAKNIVIRGNGATICSHTNSLFGSNIFCNVSSNVTLWMSNIIIKGFIPAILNGGICQFTNVTFKQNGADTGYGAIHNQGVLKCVNCSFIGNKAISGGAIYNDVGSQSTIISSIFKDNTCIQKSKNPEFSNNDENNIHTSIGASCLVFNVGDETIFINIEDEDDYINYKSFIYKSGHIKTLILNFNGSKVYNIYKLTSPFYFSNVENVYIQGNGATIKVKDNEDKSFDSTFLELSSLCYCTIKDINFVDFNLAIINNGTLYIYNSTFNGNFINHALLEDFGAAIYNNEKAYAYVAHSSFNNNNAKKGGAVYNNKGIFICNFCNFTSNEARTDGGAIYNYVGTIYCLNSNFNSNHAAEKGGALYNEKGMISCQDCNFTRNIAEDGGAIFNHYAVMSLNHTFFGKNDASDDGDAIYNDYGDILIDSCSIECSQDGIDNAIFAFGADANNTFIGDSHIIYEKGGVTITEPIKVTSEVPSEWGRWGIRIAEISACVGLTLFCTFSGTLSAGVAGAICFIGGGLLAGAEELIEGYFWEHDVNIGNVVMMVVIAGAFDYVAGAGGNIIGKKFFQVGVEELSAKAAAKLTMISLSLDIAGEILTEVIPRFDFNQDCPFNIDDFNNAIPVAS